MKNLPEIGKTYNCFDDGKIRKSRMYQVKITEIISFEKADNELLELWKEEGEPNYWLFEKTDYFIKFKSNEFKYEPNGVFARTKDGGWFGLGNLWNSGRLDICVNREDGSEYLLIECKVYGKEFEKEVLFENFDCECKDMLKISYDKTSKTFILKKKYIRSFN